MSTPRPPDRRAVDVDRALTRRGYCGAVHVPSGRRCFLPADHPDGCVFELLGTDDVEPPGA